MLHSRCQRCVDVWVWREDRRAYHAKSPTTRRHPKTQSLEQRPFHRTETTTAAHAGLGDPSATNLNPNPAQASLGGFGVLSDGCRSSQYKAAGGAETHSANDILADQLPDAIRKRHARLRREPGPRMTEKPALDTYANRELLCIGSMCETSFRRAPDQGVSSLNNPDNNLSTMVAIMKAELVKNPGPQSIMLATYIRFAPSAQKLTMSTSAPGSITPSRW